MMVVRCAFSLEIWIYSMAYGLRCWDESGNLILDVGDSISKILGNFSITYSVPTGQSAGPTATQQVTIPSGFESRFWWGSISVQKNGNQYSMSDGSLRCVIDGGVAVFSLDDGSGWSYIEPGSSVTHTIIYGTY